MRGELTTINDYRLPINVERLTITENYAAELQAIGCWPLAVGCD